MGETRPQLVPSMFSRSLRIYKPVALQRNELSLCTEANLADDPLVGCENVIRAACDEGPQLFNAQH